MAHFSKINGLPVLKAVLEDERDGIIRVSLVDDPAVMSDFQAFAEQKELQLYSVADEDQHLVRGVVMRADFPIFRRSSDGYEYYMLFTPEVVREMAQKYLTEGRCDLVNLMHEEGTDVSGVHLVQWYLKDSAAGVNPEGFEDIADGSLFAEYKVDNSEVWDAIKAGTYKGFSLEGYFGLEEYDDQKAIDAIVSELNGKFSNLLQKMGNLNKIKAALKEMLAEKFGSMATDKGVLAWDGDDEEVKVGDAVSIVAEDGSQSEAADGEYTGKDGVVVVVEGGKVTEIRTPEAEADEASEEGEGASDETEAAGEKKECAEEGEDEVESPDGGEEGDGDAIEGLRKEVDELYKIVDGILKVVGETRDSVQEMHASRIKRVCSAFSASYDEKYRALHKALSGVISGDFYIAEAGDDYAVCVSWDEDFNEVITRYKVEGWSEDGIPNIGEGTEVVAAWVKPEQKADIDASFSAMRADIDALKAQLAKVSGEPAAKPAHEEFQREGVEVRSGRAATLASYFKK